VAVLTQNIIWRCYLKVQRC